MFDALFKYIWRRDIALPVERHSMAACFISGVTDKVLMDVVVDGKTYSVTEEIGDSCSAKQLAEKIRTKLTENLSKKANVLASLEEMAKSMGMTKEEMIQVLGGKMPGTEPEPVKEVALIRPVASVSAMVIDDEKGFKAVDGTLISPIKARVSTDKEVSEHGGVSRMPAYSSVRDKDGKTVMETNKRVKNTSSGERSTLTTRSDMGTTHLAINNRDAGIINKTISLIDRNTNELVRGKITDGGRECPLCNGSGFNKVNGGTCPKCDGAGYLY